MTCPRPDITQQIHKSALQFLGLWPKTGLFQGSPGTSQLTVLHSLPFTCFLALLFHLSPACERKEFTDASSREGPTPHPVQRKCLPQLAEHPANWGKEEGGKEKPTRASGTQPWRSPGVWFQLGGQIPGSQTSAGGWGCAEQGSE